MSATDREQAIARYVRAAFENITGDVARTGSGRTQQLFKSACKLGTYIGARALTENEVTAALENAARQNGLIAKDGLKVVAAHIKRGIARGMASPADLSKIELRRVQAGDQRLLKREHVHVLPAAAGGQFAHREEIPHRPRKLSPEGARLFASSSVITPECTAGIYLRGRHCAIPPAPGDLRWHPDVYNWVHKSRWPALVGLITDAVTNTPISLHFTFLAKDGSSKAPIAPHERLYLAKHGMAGGVVRLWPNAHVTGGLLIGEGIETTLSAARAFQPAWACLDAGNLGAFPMLPGIDAITIAQDDDDAGRRGVNICAERWATARRDVRILRAA